MNKPTSRVAICTGGGRGLGRAMALGLVSAGYQVVITAAREGDEIAAVAAEAPKRAILPLVADVSDPKACEYVVAEAEARLGPVSVLVNNAGRGMRYVSDEFITKPTRFWEVDPAVWGMIILTNVNGPFFMTRALIPGMIARKWGRIVNISMNRDTMRRAGFSPYGPSKAALESETAIWAQDLIGTGITVNTLLPGGASNTGMIPATVPAAMRENLLQPDIMVAPLLWMISDCAASFTGRRVNASLWTCAENAASNPESLSEPAGC